MFKKVDNSGNLTPSAVLLLSISFFWLVVTFYFARQDILVSDIAPVTAFTALVLALQVGLLFLLRKFAPALLVIFSLGNTLFLYGVFPAGFMLRPAWQEGLIYGGVGLLYFVMFDIVRRSRPKIAKFLWLAPFFVMILAIGAITKASLEGRQNPGLLQTTKIAFVEKPNIYFLSFDAMVPPSLGAKLLSIDALPYVDVLKAHGAYFIPNVFSDAVPTKWSLANVLKLVPDNIPNYDRIVTGKIESPLRAIFAANGYTTHFTFWRNYFGVGKGPFLDQYNFRDFYDICSFLDRPAHDLGFFGYCQVRKELMRVMSRFFVKTMPPPYEDYAVADVMQIAKDKSSPHFYMQHFLFPGHTPARFSGLPIQQKDFEKTYLLYSRIAARVMDKMLNVIHDSDPKAIIFIYGDHGPWISRVTKFEDDPELFVRDRWGILGAVIDGGRCRSYLEPPAGQRFQTTARIVASLLTCLSGGKSPIKGVIDYGKIQQLEGERFEKYVYE